MKNTGQNRSARLRTSALSILFLLAAFGMMRYAGETTAQTTLTDDSTVFAQFDQWLARFSDGRFTGTDEFVQIGASLAEKRRETFKQLIRTNPRGAIERAIPTEIQTRLPASVVRFLEKPIAGRGNYNVLVIDNLESEAESYRIEREVVIGDSRFKAFVYGRRATMPTKLDIPLRGVVLDDLMAVDESAVRIIATEKADKTGITAEVGGALKNFASEKEFEDFVRASDAWESKPAPTLAPEPPSWTTGVKKLLFIRVDFPDREGVPVDRFGQVLTESFAQSLMDGPVNTFYVNNSYAKTSLRTTVTPVVRMPQPQSAYPRDNLFALVTDARNAARAAGFETNDFELDMVAFSQSGLLDFSGISPLANKGALINGNFTFKVVTHELGHTYGLLHANLWRTDDGTITGSGANVEYGDDFDMMGRGNTQATHFNANYKRSLDWLTEANIRTVTQPGVYRVYAHDTIAPQPEGIRALKIKKDSAKNYWVEFRQLMTDLPNLSDGALIRWDYPFDVTRQTQILDMKPATQTLDDSALGVSQTFYDNTSGIRITVLGKGNTIPESLDIKVEFNFSIIKGAPFDFDGDHKTDIGIFRPSNGQWWLNRSAAGVGVANFGTATDIIVPADYTGDGKTDVAFWRPSTGEWFIFRSEDNSYYSVPFGMAGDIPAPGDFDGDGRADTAIFRAGIWYIQQSTDGTAIFQFGSQGDRPVIADYDGDGKSDVAIYRPSVSQWWILRSRDGLIAGTFGAAGDQPVQGDWTGDGKADVALWRPSTGEWFIVRSEDNSYYALPFGMKGDIPAPGDYDGDGRFDTTVFRPSEGLWYLQNSANNSTSVVRFGTSGDVPVAKAVY